MIDYIFYEKSKLEMNSDLELITKSDIGPNGLPHENYPSDHLSLFVDFSFKNN